MDSMHNAIVKAWIDASDEEDSLFAPVVTWPEGTEYVSQGPFFDDEG